MALTLYLHPLSSYCWKVLTALYEGDAPFTPKIVNLGDAAERDAFLKISPTGKFPLLRDEARGRTVWESSIIIEYLAMHFADARMLVPTDPEQALKVREQDRFFDLYLHDPMQRIVADRIRPADQRDPIGIENYHGQIVRGLDMLEQTLATEWAAGDVFTMADCAAAPALYYANRIVPFTATHPKTAAYLTRLHERPSFARAFAEAGPYLHMFPLG